MYITEQSNEIRNDPALRIYGTILTLLHTLTAYFWSIGRVGYSLSDQYAPICWPGLDFCAEIPRLTHESLLNLFYAYGVCALLIAPLFLVKRAVLAGWIGLFALCACKFAIMAGDIRTALNAETVAFMVTGSFLLLPSKRHALRWTILIIYFTAGLMKLNAEWVGGDSLGKIPAWMQTIPTEFLTIYPIFLELFVIWFLLSKKAHAFWLGFAQLIVFQSIAYAFIGFYFPSVMLSLLSIFFLIRVFPITGDATPMNSVQRAKLIRWYVCTLGLFIVLQVAPAMISKSPVYTGEGKYFALNMFDTMLECDPKVSFTNVNGERVEQQFYPPDMRASNPRLTCNPISFYWRAKSVCKDGFPNGERPSDFDLKVEVKKRTENEYRSLIDIKNFCAANFEYKVLSHNEWILID
jgi:hypothetical protein